MSELNGTEGRPAGVTELLDVWKTHTSGVKSAGVLNRALTVGEIHECFFLIQRKIKSGPREESNFWTKASPFPNGTLLLIKALIN